MQSLYRCIGPAIEPWLADLKPVQVKELKECFEKMDSEGKGKGTFKPERFLETEGRMKAMDPALIAFGFGRRYINNIRGNTLRFYDIIEHVPACALRRARFLLR